MTSVASRRVAIIGAALSANKGAAAMAETVIERLPSFVGDCRFDLLTTYPEDDIGRVPSSSPVTVVGLQPMRLALVEIPVAVLAWVARRVRLPLGWVRTRACRSILDADVVVDVAGISFVDGRGMPILVYNTLMTGLPLLLGTPTVKAAQALGPFETLPNRWLAHRVLGHLAAVCARGARTREHLDGLGLSNVVDVADLAFSLDEAGSLPLDVEQRVAAAGEHIVVMPSAVVKKLFEREDASRGYVDAMVDLVSGLRRVTGLSVVIAPHSYRVGEPEGRMNDGPVCREIAVRLAGDPGTVLVDADLSAGELRHLVAGARVLVTSRFHAMISGLATATPTVVVGWSHKYREVLRDFSLEDYGCEAALLADTESVVSKVVEASMNREAVIASIRAALPAVRLRSEKNFSVIASAMAG